MRKVGYEIYYMLDIHIRYIVSIYINMKINNK